MVQKLAGRVAVITGGGGGIGGAIAMDMAAEGAKVVVNDIGKEADGSNPADKVVKQIKKAGGAAVANYNSVVTMAGGANMTLYLQSSDRISFGGWVWQID
jgi:NAD(P)-dependent dehydrogenase (short-subunit alcohol dehydrogenase family)